MIKQKKVKLIVSSLLILNVLFSLSPAKAVNSLKEPDSEKKIQNVSNQIYLVSDNHNCKVLPKRFRKSTDIQSIANNTGINTKGLESLNISGSQQFSQLNLPILLKAIDTNLPIIDFDLRQESHGFINGIPISFENKFDNANKGLSDSEVLKKQKEQLSSIKIGIPISFHNHPDETITPEEVYDEQKLVTDNTIKYIRIFATDEELPSPEAIDSFISAVKSIKKENWLHFHCKEGIGRTTTFMIFYDMMKNYDNVSQEDIVTRQIQLPDFDSDDITLLTSKERAELYNSFYDYCKQCGPDFQTAYSSYVNK